MSRAKTPSQGLCSVCGKKAGPGTAIVVFYGAGGRQHKCCAAAGHRRGTQKTGLKVHPDERKIAA